MGDKPNLHVWRQSSRARESLDRLCSKWLVLLTYLPTYLPSLLEEKLVPLKFLYECAVERCSIHILLSRLLFESERERERVVTFFFFFRFFFLPIPSITYFLPDNTSYRVSGCSCFCIASMYYKVPILSYNVWWITQCSRARRRRGQSIISAYLDMTFFNRFKAGISNVFFRFLDGFLYEEIYGNA